MANRIQDEGLDVVFLGKDLSSSKFFKKKSFCFYDISSATFSIKKPLGILLSIVKIIKGTLVSIKLIIQHKPDYIIGFGSYYSLPTLIAGVLLRKSIIIHEQNVVPGKVNALFSRFAKAVGLTFPDIYNVLRCKQKSVVTLNRSKVFLKHNSKISKDFYEGRNVLLIFGGSLGSITINKIFLTSLPFIIKKISNLSVIHIIGGNENADDVREIYSKLKVPAIVKAFEEDMSFYFRIANLAICRAGAGTVEELIYYELPAVMIPYPHAYNHQEKNALFFQENVGGGFFIKEKDVDYLKLTNIVVDLLSTSKLFVYKEKISSYKNNYEKKDFLHFIDMSLAKFC